MIFEGFATFDFFAASRGLESFGRRLSRF